MLFLFASIIDVIKIRIFEIMSTYNIENKKISSNTFIFPTFLLIIICIIKTYEINMGHNLSHLGVLPRDLDGLKGIILSPFIHGSTKHLFNNLIPLFFLTSALIHFYDHLGYKILLTIYIFSGILLWFIGRENFHIGASGIIYGLASFMFFSGVFRRNTQLLSFSLLITFLYGGMVWGIFPETVKPNVSWEGHLSGAIIGFISSIIYLKKGPQRKEYAWENEEDEEDQGNQGDVNYHYEIID